jgi:hypothetical protein
MSGKQPVCALWAPCAYQEGSLHTHTHTHTHTHSCSQLQLGLLSRGKGHYFLWAAGQTLDFLPSCLYQINHLQYSIRHFQSPTKKCDPFVQSLRIFVTLPSLRKQIGCNQIGRHGRKKGWEAHLSTCLFKYNSLSSTGIGGLNPLCIEKQRKTKNPLGPQCVLMGYSAHKPQSKGKQIILQPIF